MSVPKKGTKAYESLKPSEQQELQKADALKPHLQKFLIDTQRQEAEAQANRMMSEMKIAEKQKEERERAAHLAVLAFLEKRLWQKNPLPFECGWITGISSTGVILTHQEKEKEFHADVSGFANYLYGEHAHMNRDIKALRYPNPFQEENLEFFWKKFIVDIALLMKVDKKLGALS